MLGIKPKSPEALLSNPHQTFQTNLLPCDDGSQMEWESWLGKLCSGEGRRRKGQGNMDLWWNILETTESLQLIKEGKRTKKSRNERWRP